MTACLRASASANKILSKILMVREFMGIYKSGKCVGRGVAGWVITSSFLKAEEFLMALFINHFFSMFCKKKRERGEGFL